MASRALSKAAKAAGSPRSIVYLYFTEDSDTGGALSAAGAVPMLDQFLYMFGEGSRACVHPKDADYPSTSPVCFETLEQAQAAHPGHAWLYLDPEATVHISQYEHPDNNVVYVAGHDGSGYGDSSTQGEHVRVMASEGFAIPCLIAAAADRWSRAWQ